MRLSREPLFDATAIYLVYVLYVCMHDPFTKVNKCNSFTAYRNMHHSSTI